MLPPVPLSVSQQIASPVSHEVRIDMAGDIDALRKRDDRYRRIEYTVDGGVIHLRGTVWRGEDLMEFAQSVSKLPRVERVIVTGVQIAR